MKVVPQSQQSPRKAPSHTPGGVKLEYEQSVVIGGQICISPGVAAPDTASREEGKLNCRLIAAAWNSYDRHCGPRAVECAEADLLGQLLHALKRARHLVMGYGEAPSRAEEAEILSEINAAIGAATGGAA